MFKLPAVAFPPTLILLVTEILFAAGLLSDAQHVIDAEFNDEGWVSPQRANQARQYINIAKKIMFDMMDQEGKAA